MAITISDVAEYRGVDLNKEVTAADFEAVNLYMLGGCECCGASLACYNAFPSKTGNWRCKDCLDHLGFASAQEFEEWEESQDE